MNEDLKREICEALEVYMTDKGISASEVGRGSKVNASYLSNLRKGKFSTTTQQGETPIPDAVFRKIALFIDFALEKESWRRVMTSETIIITSKLIEAKSNGLLKAIVGETGCGKTYTIDSFMSEHKHEHVYRITVGSLHKVRDVIDDILEEMRIVVKSSSHVTKLRAIRDRIREIYLSGAHPLLIIDEAENLKLPVFGLLKQLYDITRGEKKTRMCGVVLIGTPQLTAKIERLKNRDKEGMPQFARRIKGGVEVLDNREWFKDKRFVDYVSELTGGNKGVVKLLKSMADNYGEVNDFLEPALLNAERDGRVFDLDFFREEYRIGQL